MPEFDPVMMAVFPFRVMGYSCDMMRVQHIVAGHPMASPPHHGIRGLAQAPKQKNAGTKAGAKS
jgi:hypothetical protein